LSATLNPALSLQMIYILLMYLNLLLKMVL